MNQYTVEEVLVKKSDPLYPRTVFCILKKSRRLMEVKNKYEWQDYEEYLMSDYLTERAARNMMRRREAIDNGMIGWIEE